MSWETGFGLGGVYLGQIELRGVVIKGCGYKLRDWIWARRGLARRGVFRTGRAKRGSY